MIVFNDCGFKVISRKNNYLFMFNDYVRMDLDIGVFFCKFYKVLVLFICKFLDIVYGLCLFIGVYKMLFCVLLSCVFFESVVSGF